MLHHGTFRFLCCVVVLLVGQPECVKAQPSTGRIRSTATGRVPDLAGRVGPRMTFVEVKLLVGTDGGALHSQRWLKVLEALDVSLQIVKAELDEVPAVRERTVGTLRYVTAIGTLDRSGNISFPGRLFTASDGARLKEWIEELRTYGAQGSPEGQELWGLSKEQFGLVFESLEKIVDTELMGQPIRVAVSRLPLSEQYPIQWSQAATDTLNVKSAPGTVRQEVRGFSTGTALAIALNDCGLCFRPRRTAEGTLGLLIDPVSLHRDFWNVGWPLQKQRIKAAPKFFAITTIELDDVTLGDVFGAVSELSETPVMIDYAALDAHQIDPTTLKVSFKRAQTSWSLALKQMVVPQKLSREIWQDEAGRTFVWITTNRPLSRSKHAVQ